MKQERLTREQLDEVSGNAHVTLRSDRPVERLLADVLALLDLRLADLH